MKKTDLDAADIRILNAIQKHGRLSKTKLAEIVNLSPTPCWVRFKKLEAAGIIRGYRTEIAVDRIGDFIHVIVTVSLTHHRKSDFERFESHIGKLGEVAECFATGGGMDYVLSVFSPSLADFQNLMESLLGADIGIQRYMTYIVTREIKSEPPDIAELIAKTEK